MTLKTCYPRYNGIKNLRHLLGDIGVGIARGRATRMLFLRYYCFSQPVRSRTRTPGAVTLVLCIPLLLSPQ